MKPKFARRIAALAIAVTPIAASVSNAEPYAAAAITVTASRHLDGDISRSITQGMTDKEVLAAIGAPSTKMRFPRSKTTAWDYDFHDTWGYDANFSVIMNDAGVVVGTFAARYDGG